MRIEQTMIGAPVFTQDGSQVGKVKEIHGAFFKVDAPFQPDFWLSQDHIGTGSTDELRLSFSEDRLADYKLGDPEDYAGEHAEEGAEYGREHAEEGADVTGRGGGYRGGGTGDFGPGSNDGAGLGSGIEFDTDRPGAGNISATPSERYGQESDLPPTTAGAGAMGGGGSTVGMGSMNPMGTGQPTTGWGDAAAGYQSQFQTHYGTSGARWEDFEPAYRYGHEMSYDPRYQGRDFNEVEPELRQNYGPWSQHYGYRSDDNAWERIKEHVGEAMSRGRSKRAA